MYVEGLGKKLHKGTQAEEGCAGVCGELVGVMAGAKGITHGCGKKLGWKGGWQGPPCQSSHFGFYFLSKEELLWRSDMARPMILKPTAVYGSIE